VKKFDTSSLGKMKCHLCIEFVHLEEIIFMTWWGYFTIEFGMDECNMCLVPTHDNVKLLVDMGSKEINPTSIRGLLGN
jgi:hypothetical protein